MKPARASLRHIRHWVGFGLAGGLAFLVDALVTLALVYFAGMNPYLARAIAMALAMITAWLMHRRFTFSVASPPSAAEFARFATVAGTANALNYGLYTVFLVARSGTRPLSALVASTLIAMVVSYLGFRFGVFRARRTSRT